MGEESDRTRTSRRLARALRHRPDEHGIALGPGGWADVGDVLAALGLTSDELRAIVDAPGRRRFEQAGDRIRALHGHSVAIEIDHPVEPPPLILFHGTVAARVNAIRERGLLPLGRRYVHLTSSRAEAITIGGRRGAPILLEVRALALYEERGTPFLHVVGSTIWLVGHVPADHLVIPQIR